MINLIESITARGLLYVVNSRDAKLFDFAGGQKIVSICFGTRDTAAAAMMAASSRNDVMWYAPENYERWIERVVSVIPDASHDAIASAVSRASIIGGFAPIVASDVPRILRKLEQRRSAKNRPSVGQDRPPVGSTENRFHHLVD